MSFNFSFFNDLINKIDVSYCMSYNFPSFKRLYGYNPVNEENVLREYRKLYYFSDDASYLKNLSDTSYYRKIMKKQLIDTTGVDLYINYLKLTYSYKDHNSNNNRLFVDSIYKKNEKILVIQDNPILFSIHENKETILNVIQDTSNFYTEVKNNLFTDSVIVFTDSLMSNNRSYVKQSCWEEYKKENNIIYDFGISGRYYIEGVLGFSKVYINFKKDMGIFVYDYLGNSLCGEKQIILFYIRDERYVVYKKITLAVY